MGSVTPEVRELARMLLASEASAMPPHGQWATAADRTWSRLRAHLVRLIGLDGFRAVLSRSLVLARAEAPWLESARVAPDGLLQGVSGAASEPDVGRETEAHVAVLAQLIELLVLLIGGALTVRLLGDIWPEVMLGNKLSGLEVEGQR